MGPLIFLMVSSGVLGVGLGCVLMIWLSSRAGPKF